MPFTIQSDSARILNQADGFAWAHSSHVQEPEILQDAILRTTQQTGDRVEIHHDPMILNHDGHTQHARRVYKITDADHLPLLELHDLGDDHNIPNEMQPLANEIKHTFAGVIHDPIGKDIMYHLSHEIKKATPGNSVYIHAQDHQGAHASSALSDDEIFASRIRARFAQQARKLRSDALQNELSVSTNTIQRQQRRILVLQEILVICRLFLSRKILEAVQVARRGFYRR